MGDPLKKTQPGQRLEIPAEAYNAFIDAARHVRDQRHNVGQDLLEPPRQSGIIKVRNRSGAPRERFDVLMLHEPIVSPTANEQQFKNSVALDGYSPSEQATPSDPKVPVLGQRFVILLEPLAENAIGRATVAGVSVVRVNVIRDSDRFAEIDDGASGSLRSTPLGTARILWKESGTGVKWAVVRLSDRPRFAIFELSGTWFPGNPSADPPEPDGWMKMPGCKPVLYSGGAGTYSADTAEPTQTLWHATGYPAAERESLLSLLRSTGQVPSKHACGEWAWCVWHDQESRWQLLEGYEDHWRFKLLTPLSKCGSAQAQLVLYSTGYWCPVPLTFTVHDAIGLANWETIVDSGGNVSLGVPAGTFGVAKHFADSCKWEVLTLGEGCCGGTVSGSSSSSGYSSSSSDYSSSGSSSGTSSSYASSSGSSSAPSSSQGSSSGSDSGSSGSSGSSNGSSGSSSSGSGSSSSGSQACVSISETDVRCESGKLNIYKRSVSICLTGAGLARYEGAWVLSHQAGCCCCNNCGDSSSSSGSVSSSGTSGSGSGTGGGSSSSLEEVTDSSSLPPPPF